jgi:hypothetical protein
LQLLDLFGKSRLLLFERPHFCSGVRRLAGFVDSHARKNDDSGCKQCLLNWGEPSKENERLKQENETLRRELALARNHSSQWRRQMEDSRISGGRASNLLAGVSHLVHTNSFNRTNSFALQELRDVGVGSLDDALQTSLHALFSPAPLRMETFVHPESLLARRVDNGILDQFREALRGASEVRVSHQNDNLDGSVDITLELNYPVGTEGQPFTGAAVHMRPFESGYRLDSLSAYFVAPSALRRR